MGAIDNIKNSMQDRIDTLNLSGIGRMLLVMLTLLLLLIGITGFIWDSEPGLTDVNVLTEQKTSELGVQIVTGSTITATTLHLAETLLQKSGGYLTNDILPPGVLMDNIPHWEFGVLVQLRDISRTLRNNLSRSQSQSSENPALVMAENQFYFDNDKWILPATEDQYFKAISALATYLENIGSTAAQDAQFYARADNLRIWLAEVETRLGSLSQRLSASVGKRQLDTSLAGDAAATQSTKTSKVKEVKTPWTELDDVFYEARGTTWALLHLLQAIEVDFKDVLAKKNATISLQQIIRELESTQDTVWSLVILNGDGLGMLANHSLVMGSHISRANAAIIDLRRLLQEG